MEFCPGKVLGLAGGQVQLVSAESCVACGRCEQLCPDYAIWLEDAGDKDEIRDQDRPSERKHEGEDARNAQSKEPGNALHGRVLLQGNEAVAEGALAAGMRFFAGYPITPSTEIAEYCALRLPQVGGCFIQMEDELASLAAVIGASSVGVKAMTATSGPGFSLMQENIGYAALAEIPCVIVDVQRAGPSTGLPTSPSQGDYMQARWGTHGDHPVIVLSPSSVQEAYTETIRAFNLAECLRMPVILLMDEMVGHMREGIELSMTRSCSPGEYMPHKPPFGQGAFYNITGLIHDEEGFPTSSPEVTDRQLRRILEKTHTNRIERYEELDMEDARVCVVSFGGTARSARAAVDIARRDGTSVGLFRPVTVWPFPEEALDRICGQVRDIIVAEMNYGQMKLEIERVAAGRCRVHHIGKVNGTQITPGEIYSMIQTVLAWR